MRCSKCGFDNPGGMKFCGQCTTPLALVCPNCHFENPPASGVVEAAAADGERKTVTNRPDVKPTQTAR